MHAGKSGESTPAATKGRRRLGHRLTFWSVPDNVRTSTFTIMTTPSAPLRRLRAFFLLAATPPVPGGEHPVLAIHSHLRPARLRWTASALRSTAPQKNGGRKRECRQGLLRQSMQAASVSRSVLLKNG